jgi:hypothetical protein
VPHSTLLIAAVVFVLFGLVLLTAERRTADRDRVAMRRGPVAIAVAFAVFGAVAAVVGLR